ncbi:unnamed protein product [Callosobruchus maculatus]|uniref:Uncharacterized protein n=1 Tax=Callosobruchus maculatus TaxID=64391 RepID=A0A653DBF8_CALMS|nr:unnamed protein product [Callosobruchus maculatus]
MGRSFTYLVNDLFRIHKCS